MRVEVSLAGPRRPQDRIAAGRTVEALAPMLAAHPAASSVEQPGNGAVAIAAITSCTNTSDPRLLVAAGLLARKARRFGLTPPAWVKTSLAPGSPTAERYLRRAGLLEDLEAVGFGIVGYGCTTCIGNSGPLPAIIEQAMAERNILPVAVLSGNRNFPGRVHPQLEAGFLASPPLVVAFALAGDVNRDILTDPIGRSHVGRRHPPGRSLADGRRDRCGPRHRHRCRRLRNLIRRGRGERGLARARCAGHSPCSPGTRARPTFGARPSRASARARCSAPMQRIRCSCSATTSPPTTSRRPGRSRRREKPPNIWSSGARTVAT